jgi:hypothetical protein
VHLRERDELQHGNGAVQRVETTLIIERGRRAREEEPVAGPQFVYQADDVLVGGKPVMVEAIQGPLPPLVAKA